MWDIFDQNSVAKLLSTFDVLKDCFLFPVIFLLFYLIIVLLLSYLILLFFPFKDTLYLFDKVQMLIRQIKMINRLNK